MAGVPGGRLENGPAGNGMHRESREHERPGNKGQLRGSASAQKVGLEWEVQGTHAIAGGKGGGIASALVVCATES